MRRKLIKTKNYFEKSKITLIKKNTLCGDTKMTTGNDPLHFEGKNEGEMLVKNLSAHRKFVLMSFASVSKSNSSFAETI